MAQFSATLSYGQFRALGGEGAFFRAESYERHLTPDEDRQFRAAYLESLEPGRAAPNWTPTESSSPSLTQGMGVTIVVDTNRLAGSRVELMSDQTVKMTTIKMGHVSGKWGFQSDSIRTQHRWSRSLRPFDRTCAEVLAATSYRGSLGEQLAELLLPKN
jgi:hypothetical protein